MLIGNVGRDPEVRYLDGNGQAGQGTKVATFTLATTERYRDRSGEQRENTEWHNIVAWRQSADVAERFIRKGTQVFIEGRLRTRSYTDQQGVKKYTTEITVDNLQLLGRRDGETAPQGSYSQQGSYGQGGYQQPYQQQAQQYQQPYQQPIQQAAKFQQPAPQPAQQYQQPVQQTPQAVDLSIDDPNDDLPF